MLCCVHPKIIDDSFRCNKIIIVTIITHVRFRVGRLYFMVVGDSFENPVLFNSTTHNSNDYNDKHFDNKKLKRRAEKKEAGPNLSRKCVYTLSR